MLARNVHVVLRIVLCMCATHMQSRQQMVRCDTSCCCLVLLVPLLCFHWFVQGLQ